MYTHTWNSSVSHSVVFDSLWPHGLYNPRGSSAHRTLQARILEWVAIFFSRGSSRPRDFNPGLLHCKRILYHLSYQGSNSYTCVCVCLCIGLAEKFFFLEDLMRKQFIYVCVCVFVYWIGQKVFFPRRSYEKTQMNFLFSPIHKTGYKSILGANLKNFWE